jgi:hypothetical protein
VSNRNYFGGKERNEHESKKLRDGRSCVGKTAVLGLREGGGRTMAMTVANTDKETIHTAIMDNVEVGSTLLTDEATTYAGMDGLFFVALELLNKFFALEGNSIFRAEYSSTKHKRVCHSEPNRRPLNRC